MHTLQIVSIALEALIAILAIAAARNGRGYLLGLALTFAIYVYYDLARLYAWELGAGVLPVMFFIATLSALVSVWGLLRKRRA